MTKTYHLPVAIIGAGPVGLAAASHLVKRQIPFVLLESGDTPGANILTWSHVRVFSPWLYNIDKAARELLEQTNWIAPDENGIPTGKQLVHDYLIPLSQHPAIHPNIYTNSRVIAIGRKGLDKMKTNGRELYPFELHVLQEKNVIKIEASAVIDASGTWHNQNPVGSGGIQAIGEAENYKHIFYGIPDVMGKYQERYKNKHVLVVGGGHSAINTILELNKLKDLFPETQISWVMRKKRISDVFGGQENDALEARGELGIRIEQLIEQDKVNVYTPFQIQEISRKKDKLYITGTQHDKLMLIPDMDEIVCNTGTRPDQSFLREVRVEFDATVESVPAIADLIDPNKHSCGTVRPHGELELQQKEKDFYVVGMKSYGRAPTFLMATGYEQVRSIAAALAGDMEAARKVELDLPETGVCSTGNIGGVACCTV